MIAGPSPTGVMIPMGPMAPMGPRAPWVTSVPWAAILPRLESILPIGATMCQPSSLRPNNSEMQLRLQQRFRCPSPHNIGTKWLRQCSNSPGSPGSALSHDMLQTLHPTLTNQACSPEYPPLLLQPSLCSCPTQKRKKKTQMVTGFPARRNTPYSGME